MKLRTLLRLFRIPNVFTAFADVLAGVVLARGAAPQLRDGLLVLASGCLYCGGMVLNDYFDRHVDATERPERPIPAGEASAQSVLIVGALLLAAGLGLAVAHGPRGGLIASALAAAILLYDGVLKQGPLGPVAMGACRGLNVMLGLFAAEPELGFISPLPWLQFAYTYLITRLSRFEVGGADPAVLRGTLSAFAALLLVALSGLLLAVLRAMAASQGDALSSLLALALLLGLAVRYGGLLRPLWHTATGPLLGRAIGGGILLMPVLDGAFVAAAGQPLWAIAVAALLLPGLWLKRWYYLT